MNGRPPQRRNAFYAQAGGVTAVLNATAAALIETCRANDDRIGKVFAGRSGILGALDEALIDTSLESEETLRALRHTPGGAFGSARFRIGRAGLEDHAVYERLVDVFRAHDIGYVFYNGGNGSADTTLQLSRIPEVFGHPLACIHVPKTIDNDILDTDCSPGFGSAAKYLAVSMREAAADVASMTATSTRVFVLEAMGRHAGWMVAAMGLAADSHNHPPHLLLFAERPFEEEEFLRRVSDTVARHGYCVIGVSEGLRTPDGRFIAEIPATIAGRNEQLGGVAPVLARLVHGRLGLKCHWATADYLQRSARHIASATDLAHAEAVGREAVRLALAGRTAVMPVIERISDHPYRWQLGVADLAGIATREKCLPRDFITDSGYHISARARAYLLPLIQGETDVPFRDGLPVHARLRAVTARKKLPPWDPHGERQQVALSKKT
ncbi:MAG: diphosphate--fructose-6-phosphate 1-phosphotransferase [Betaproteobacteria bacterium]|nr:diphosphate--fructose-6-phosphate 1-phosphotransferase [Betaproteobacteria bacterium]